MLHRAASNAYSWWWASHIRTKQSKWLEQNLQDMEDKVEDTLKIVNNDGDSFAQRAEMYYRKRPEIINFVEEAYRSYRALAERYDHLSRDFQSANRTIATVFPEQVQFSIDAEDEENLRQTSTSPRDFNKSNNINKNIPKVPKIPTKDFRGPSFSRKGQLKRSSSSAKVLTPSSGLSKDEALGEIDNLQKGILALQTEKEFVKSTYERGYEKYWDIENVITEMQAKVCSLQDEFGIGIVIDDNEARSLMATTALKSCRETLTKLEDQQEESVVEAKTEYQRIIEAHERFAALRNRFETPNQTENNEPIDKPKRLDPSKEEKGLDSDLLSEKIKERLAVDSHTPLTMTQLAEKLDELVDVVVSLETSVASEKAMVKRLRSEIDQLYENLQSLEEEKEILIEDSENLRKKLKQLEEELERVNSLNRSLEDENESLRKQLAEANCTIDDLSEKLQNVKMEEDIDENAGLFPETRSSDEKDEPEIKENDEDKLLAPEEDPTDGAKPEEENVNEIENPQKKYMSETASSTVYLEQEDIASEEGEEIPNWKQLSLNGLDDRERIILEEYTSVLKNYKVVQRKLSDVEKKNRDGFIELALQIRELKNAVSIRDEEIHALRSKLSSRGTNVDGNHDTRLSECNNQETITQGASSPASNITSPHSNQRPILDSSSSDRIFDFKERREIEEHRSVLKSTRRDREQHYSNVKGKSVKSHHAVPSIEETIRSDIDELLEENLEFWLRFSTSFHQMRKFYTSVQDLKSELYKLKAKKRPDSSSPNNVSINSDARPIYKHLREIQTELTLWIENNSVLKDEVHDKYSSLCNIQDEITRVTSVDVKGEDTELSQYQAAKFHGEIMNMKQENKKISDELALGLDRVKNLRKEVEKTLTKLEEEFRQHAPTRSPSSRTRIPLRSFLFPVKLKKQKEKKQASSLFSCMNPSLQKQYSYITSTDVPQ